jgi:molybdenum cofactor cytidylyltransferase
VIARVVRALREGGADLVVVVSPPSHEPFTPTLTDEAAAAGAEVIAPMTQPPNMRASIEHAIQYLDTLVLEPKHVLLAPADSPGISSRLVAGLLEATRTSPRCIVIPVVGDRRGHPIVIPWSLARTIPALPAGVGVNALVAKHAERVLEYACDDPAAIADLDTPEDYERLRDLEQGVS